MNSYCFVGLASRESPLYVASNIMNITMFSLALLFSFFAFSKTYEVLHGSSANLIETSTATCIKLKHLIYGLYEAEVAVRP